MPKKKVSLITSMFNCRDYIDRFMENITNQTAFNDCDLILLDANEVSERPIVESYLDQYDNIKHFHISEFGILNDPGVYGCWNLAIRNSDSDFITNTNLDDSRSRCAIESQISCLNDNPDIDVAYYRTLETNKPNETFENNSAEKEFPCLDYSFDSLMRVNSPHCQPMWRRSIHNELGLFNDTLMSAGDYEMWLRCAQAGIKMKKIDKILGLYFRNPEGVSSGSKTLDKAIHEVMQVRKQYTRSYM